MTPPPSRGRLRVGLLVDSLMQPAWVVEAVRQIIRDGIAEIVCVVVNEAGESPVPRKLPALQRVARWVENRDVLAYAAYQRFDARRYPPARDPERHRVGVRACGTMPLDSGPASFEASLREGPQDEEVGVFQKRRSSQPSPRPLRR